MVEFECPEGATPLTREDCAGLRLSHITTRDELNRWEQDNILEAMAWLEKTKPIEILNESFIKRLHKQMFGMVWEWAGKFRDHDTNIGVPCYQILSAVHNLCDDVPVWIKEKSYPEEMMGVILHHRLVKIHPFPNGNGRHARLMADIFAENLLGLPRFTWGGGDISNAGNVRERYIKVLKIADSNYDYAPLLEFATS